MCNLSFRGHREQTGSGQGTNGSFICFIELLAKCDPILEELISKPKGQVKYIGLSPKI
jgi:hypothetical protein